MNIGVIGIGDIAEKAYFPIYAMQREHHFHCFTRNTLTQKRIQEKYGFHIHYDLDSLLAVDLHAVMIHAATAAHEELIQRCLIAGIPVFVDKPVTDDIKTTGRILQYAKNEGVPLMAGFNRRFAPHYVKAEAMKEKNMILLQKNRRNLPGDLRTFVYDDYIHVLDTLLHHLGGEPDKWEVSGEWKGSMLASIVLTMKRERVTAIGIMNRDAGVNEEILEVVSPSGKMVVRNLSELFLKEGHYETKARTGDWTPTLEIRGFQAMVNTFFSAVEKKERMPMLVEEIMNTHNWCEKIIDKLEKNRG
ncbi:gfo/Idh/MocA family oxidoreductase [Bacillus lacus]|uniref:Gfo/Idh/MocA family oxidoreductase n=1 Tax=Metabacillus lacus TaxID=1983721 RepID=A0A7X2J2M0_9BACI|nr:gfo/Idh/MocA family oxidoreductase [Metabacillus lacus]